MKQTLLTICLFALASSAIAIKPSLVALGDDTVMPGGGCAGTWWVGDVAVAFDLGQESYAQRYGTAADLDGQISRALLPDDSPTIAIVVVGLIDYFDGVPLAEVEADLEDGIGRLVAEDVVVYYTPYHPMGFRLTAAGAAGLAAWRMKLEQAAYRAGAGIVGVFGGFAEGSFDHLCSGYWRLNDAGADVYWEAYVARLTADGW